MHEAPLRFTLSTTRPLTWTSPDLILDWTRALLMPLMREEIQLSSLTFPDPILLSTASSNRTPEKFNFGSPSESESPAEPEAALAVAERNL